MIGASGSTSVAKTNKKGENLQNVLKLFQDSGNTEGLDLFAKWKRAQQHSKSLRSLASTGERGRERERERERRERERECWS